MPFPQRRVVIEGSRCEVTLRRAGRRGREETRGPHKLRRRVYIRAASARGWSRYQQILHPQTTLYFTNIPSLNDFQDLFKSNLFVTMQASVFDLVNTGNCGCSGQSSCNCGKDCSCDNCGVCFFSTHLLLMAEC